VLSKACADVSIPNISNLRLPCDAEETRMAASLRRLSGTQQWWRM